MIQNREIYQMQRDIEDLKNKTPENTDMFKSDFGELPDDIGDTKIVFPDDFGQSDYVYFYGRESPSTSERVSGYFLVNECNINFNISPYPIFNLVANNHYVIYSPDKYFKNAKLKNAGSYPNNKLIAQHMETNNREWFNELKRAGFTVTLKTNDSEPLPYYEQKQLRASNENIKAYKGREGQIVINKTNKTVHVMDGSKLGGYELARKSDLEEVFTHVSNGKIEIETAIIDKGGTVSKENDLPTFTELSNAIKNTSTEDIVGKQKMLDVILAKLPSLEGVLTIKSSLSEFAKYMMLIGPTNFVLRDKLEQIKVHDVNAINNINKVSISYTPRLVKVGTQNKKDNVAISIESRNSKIYIYKNNKDNVTNSIESKNHKVYTYKNINQIK